MGRGQSFINVSTSCRRAKTDKQTKIGHNIASVSKGPAFSSFIQQVPILAWAVSELTDTSRNSRAAMKCCYSLYSYVGTAAMISVSYVGTAAIISVSYVGDYSHDKCQLCGNCSHDKCQLCGDCSHDKCQLCGDCLQPR